ncbi:geranylgeranyl pyrophosphate synthase-like isoform X2 [Bolinopsis microptera]|uniref:geranylgeranyl pyrophosphate synthase-like isoform X2 n=1 Tax=Bolinopsis microptera TaxID=2820187 RepID=UPI00307A4A8D
MTHCNGSSVDKLKEKNLNGHASGHASGHTSSNVEDEVNAKYMRCLEEPYKYHTQVPGKAIRDQTIEAMNLWLGVEKNVLQKIKEVITMLHEASLLIDDIQDNSKMRRGQPAAYLIYGISEVINIANLKYFEAGKIALELGSMTTAKNVDKSEASKIFHDWMIKLHQGQGLDIHWRDHYICPTVDEYIDMVLKKTGGLMMLAFDLMYIFRNQSETKLVYDNGRKFLETFSKFFQIRDDFCNLWDVKYAANKSYCEDLTEGKYSWVIIQGIIKERELGTTRVTSILKQRTTSDEIKSYCCQVLESLKVKSETTELLETLEKDLLEQIEGLGGNKMFIKIVGLLSPSRIQTVQ